MINAHEELELNSMEYCFLTTDTYWPQNFDTWPVYIPKLMPLLTARGMEKVNVPFNNNIFCNAPECKPQTARSFTFKNHMNIKRLQNTCFRKHEFDHEGSPGYLKGGTRLMCVAMDKNPRDIYISDFI